MYYDPIGRFLGPWSETLCTGSLALRIGISIILAAVIGCERSSKRHAAGLRTFILVSISSTGAMILDQLLFEDSAQHSFALSAGVIIAVAIISINCVLYSSRSQIKGLTTGSGLWTTSIIGLAIGAGYYTVTFFMFIAFYCSLAAFPTFETYLKNRSNHFEVHIELTNPSYLQDFVTTVRKLGLAIDDIEANPAYAGSGLSVYSVLLSIHSPELKKYKTHSEIIQALASLKYIYHIEEIE
ncbi:MAG: MgtC/SapB family protein [Firmicutes bacterium]|nr:MgtC/SapB family protein [Bacillota bacterium]